MEQPKKQQLSLDHGSSINGPGYLEQVPLLSRRPSEYRHDKEWKNLTQKMAIIKFALQFFFNFKELTEICFQMCLAYNCFLIIGGMDYYRLFILHLISSIWWYLYIKAGGPWVSVRQNNKSVTVYSKNPTKGTQIRKKIGCSGALIWLWAQLYLCFML